MNWTNNPTHNKAINQAIQSAIDANTHAAKAHQDEVEASQRMHDGSGSWATWNDANNESEEADAHATHCNNNVTKAIKDACNIDHM